MSGGSRSGQRGGCMSGGGVRDGGSGVPGGEGKMNE